MDTHLQALYREVPGSIQRMGLKVCHHSRVTKAQRQLHHQDGYVHSAAGVTKEISVCVHLQNSGLSYVILNCESELLELPFSLLC